MSEEIRELIDRMKVARAKVLAVVEDLEADALNWQPDAERWSVRQTLAHLASAEQGHRQVAEWIAAGKEINLPDFDLDRWNNARVAERADWSVQRVMSEMARTRQETLELIEKLDAAALERSGEHPAWGPLSVRDIFRIIAIHDRMHLRDVKKLLNEQRQHRGSANSSHDQ